MLKRQLLFRLLIVVSALASSAMLAYAQGSSNQPNRAETKAWVSDYLRYFKLDAQASAEDIEKITDLKLKILAPSTSLPDRQAAYKELYGTLFRLTGFGVNDQTLTSMTQTAAQATHKLLTEGQVKPVGNATTPLGQLGHVEKMGRGPVPMILLADVRADWTIYQSFMERNASKYTMYAITLPGFGGTPPPPRTGIFDPAVTPWWDGVEQGVIQLIEKNRLSKPVIVGTLASAYLAARLALKHPEKVRAAVLLNGLVYSPMRSFTNRDAPATLAERRSLLAKQPTAIGLLNELAPPFLASKETMEALVNAPAQAQRLLSFTRNPERGKALVMSATLNSDPRAYRYNTELLFTDLSDDFKNLKVPVLAISAIHDDNSPAQGGSATAEWTEMKLKYPTIPLTSVFFENTRNYITEEAPQELDRAVEAFLAGKPVEGKSGRSIAARPSPRASAMQAIGATEVTIAYGRPQVKERKIWGGLVPYNRVWRAGANEATTITLSSDVLIEGQKLAAGTYALSAIPTETEWTLTFNKVATQWGAFYYNSEFDALRVKVKPQTAEHQEWLSYNFEILSPTSAQVTLHWEKVKVAFKIELEAAKASATGQ